MDLVLLCKHTGNKILKSISAPGLTSRILFLSFVAAIFVMQVPCQGAMAAEPSTPVTLYVAPNGTGNECSVTNPCAIEGAKAQAQRLTQQAPRDITVQLASGTYPLEKPITFSAADSGANGHMIRYIAEKNGATFLSGAVPISHWTLDDPKLNIWSAPLPSSVHPSEATGMMPRSFLVNGERAERARMVLTPQTAGPPRRGDIKLTDRGYFLDLSGMERWKNPKDIEIVYTNAWSMVRCPVDTVSAGKISIQSECWNAIQKNYTYKYGVGLNWLENNRAFLTKPGQWYLDETEKKIYYIPKKNEKLNETNTELARTEQLMLLKGVSNVSFEGLTFKATNWYGYRNTNSDQRYVGYAPHQSGDNAPLHQQPLAAVDIMASHHIAITHSVFTQIGGSGVNVGNGSSDITITEDDFKSIAASGVQVGSPSEMRETNAAKQNANILIHHNRFSDNGSEYWDNPAIMAYFMRDSKISHNDIEKCPWSCIAFGWGWGFNATYNQNDVIANNHIHDGMQHLYDGGGIYTNGKTLGNIVLENNVIERIGTIDVADCEHSYWPKNFQGIYHDEGSDDYIDRNNLVINIVPKNLAASGKDECRGYWLKTNTQIHIDLKGNATDFDHVFISPKGDIAQGCVAGDSVTHCVLGESENIVSPDVERSPRAKSIRAHAGLMN
jgi:hypothetical protein